MNAGNCDIEHAPATGEERTLGKLMDLIRRNAGREHVNIRLLSGALDAERRVRHFLLESGGKKVTEKNLLEVLKKIPDALEAPSVRWLILDIRELALWPHDEPLAFDDPDFDDPGRHVARKEWQRGRKKLLRAVGAALGSVPQRRPPRYPLAVLERIKELAREKAREAGTVDDALDEVARRYGFNSGDSFREVLKVARRRRFDL
jgi:hypothetical protein